MSLDTALGPASEGSNTENSSINGDSWNQELPELSYKDFPLIELPKKFKVE